VVVVGQTVSAASLAALLAVLAAAVSAQPAHLRNWVVQVLLAKATTVARLRVRGLTSHLVAVAAKTQQALPVATTLDLEHSVTVAQVKRIR
jgi:hypothetical protein